jgi:hypothetical protein
VVLVASWDTNVVRVVKNFLKCYRTQRDTHYGPGVDSASNINEYQEYFLGGKGGQCVGLINLPPSLANCNEIWEPQTSVTLRVCLGLYMNYFTFTLSQWRTQEFFFRGGGEVFNKFSWGQRAERTGILGRYPPSKGFHSICKWVKPVFWLGCCGCIFHGTGNSAQLCQNFRISWGDEPPKPPSVRHCPIELKARYYAHKSRYNK